MIDRHARDIAAEVLCNFMEGSISNREYEDKYPSSRVDAALWGIYASVWFCYSDLSDHTLTGKHALSEKDHETMQRCLLFLRSDLEFQWPPAKIRFRYWLLRLIGLGHIVEQWARKEMSVGDVEAWPFLTKAQYEEFVPRMTQESNR